MTFKLATMCSGIGSPEQSIKELGVPHINVFACEKDKFARQTYLANFTPGVMLCDMTTEAWDSPEQYADLIVAGIPCQSFSLAGKRQGEKDPRGLLIYDFIRYVKNQRPKVFIIENVKGLLSDMGGVTFSRWCELLGKSTNGQSHMFNHPDTLGYNLHYRVLNAKHYGLPQNRERVFLIGIRPDLPDSYVWPKKMVLKDRLIDLLEPVVDEKYYLSDTALAYLTNGTENGWSDRMSMLNHYKGVPYNMLEIDLIKVGQLPGFESRGRVYSDKGLSPALTSCVGGQKVPLVQVKETTKQGYATAENGEPYLVEHRGHKNKKAKIIDTGISPTFRSESHGHETKVVYENRIRRYTPLETMRLQGFPDEFVKPCSDSQTYRQSGNSIPVHLMKAIIKNLLHLL
jgi:DNA (cytosine-5)-methyltransferase 1